MGAVKQSGFTYTGGAFSLDEIVEGVVRIKGADDEEDEVEQVELEKPPISRLEAQRSFSGCQAIY
jgi:hypothetical protein